MFAFAIITQIVLITIDYINNIVYPDINNYPNVKYKIFDEEDLWEFDVEQLDNYSKLRLIVDFVASMTDKYSVELYQKFAGMKL